MNDQFNAAYWASKPPEVRALDRMESFSSERSAKALELAQAGHIIDTEIEAIGFGNPFDTMRYREMYGWKWYPSLIMSHYLPPGTVVPVEVPGYKPYTDAAPEGAVKVSTNIADYPPYEKPVPVVVPDLPLVGGLMIADLFLGGPGDSQSIPSGYESTDSRGTFVKVVIANPFGGARYWKKVK